MRKLSLILTCFYTLMVFQGISQDEDLKKAKNSAKVNDRLLLDVYHENWIHGQDTLQTKWHSRGFGGSFMYDKPFGKGNFALAIGLGVHTHHVFSNGYVSRIIHPDQDSVIDASIPENYSTFSYFNNDEYKRHKLVTTYIDLPVEVRIRTNPDDFGNQIKIYVGGMVGYRLDVHDKTVRSEGKFKSYIFPDVAKWRYGATLRAGYQRFTLFAYYQFSHLFEDNKGVEINPFSVGLTITLLE